jgi:hypothetical protein
MAGTVLIEGWSPLSLSTGAELAPIAFVGVV